LIVVILYLAWTAGARLHYYYLLLMLVLFLFFVNLMLQQLTYALISFKLLI